MSPDELAIFAAVVSVVIAQEMTLEEVELVSAVLDQISVTLETIAVQRAALKAKK